MTTSATEDSVHRADHPDSRHVRSAPPLQTSSHERAADTTRPHSRIVIVGGGAGGLKLACKLGRRFARGHVLLVDASPSHVWKPELHELAAGTLDAGQEELSYVMLARDNGFEFVLGTMSSLDAEARTIGLDAVDIAEGEPLLPPRTIGYTDLVLAVGSSPAFFGTPGAEEHCLVLNDTRDAERFRLRMLAAMSKADRAKAHDASAGVDIVIVGAGATGVELAAELREAAEAYASYGFERLDPERDVRLTLLEGAPRILAPLEERVAAKAAAELESRGVKVVADCLVARVGPADVEDKSGRTFAADLCMWTAGIGAPAFLGEIGLPTGRGGRVEVDDRLQVHHHERIHAFGDCANCTDVTGARVPQRAQSAHQQAAWLADAFVRRHRGTPRPRYGFAYKDHGSLVSLGAKRAVGSVTGDSWFVEGLFARTAYTGLRLMHLKAVVGWWRTAALWLGRTLSGRARPRVKLH